MAESQELPPTGPAESAKLWTLSPLDDIMPDIDLCFILCFACPDDSQDRAAEILGHSYAKLVSDNPVLGATIQPLSSTAKGARRGTKVVLRPAECDNEPIPSTVLLRICDGRAEIAETYAELSERVMPPRYLRPALVMPSRETGVPGIRRTAAAQATFIRDGCLLAFNTSHAFMDATGAACVLATWAEHAAASAANRVSPSVFLAPSPADTATLNPRVDAAEYHDTLKHNARAWHMLGLDYRPREASSAVLASRIAPRGPVVTRLFRVEAGALSRLKASCAAAASSWISTNDALAALIWRSVIEARAPGGRSRAGDSTATTLMVAMSARNTLSPAISASYLGNVVLYAISASTTRSLTSSAATDGDATLGSIAHRVRTAIQTHQQPDTIRTALRLAASIPDVSSLGLVYPTWLEDDVVLSSWYGLPLYRTAWGGTFGGCQSPDFVRFPLGLFEGISFVMPRKQDGSVELSITMYQEDMARLLGNTGFIQYAVPILW